MKKKQQHIRIEIENPCTVPLEQMTPTEGGYYCVQCEKIVQDFRFMDDHAVANSMQKQMKQAPCGIFRPDQLDRTLPLQQPQQVRQSRTFIPAAMLTAGLLLGTEISAHDDKQVQKIGQAVMVHDDTLKCTSKFADIGEGTNGKLLQSDTIHRIIHGRVIDAETSQPIAGVFIVTLNKQDVRSDSLGNFSLEILYNKDTPSITIAAVHLGYERKVMEIKATRHSLLTLKLKPYPKVDDNTLTNSESSAATVTGQATTVLSKFGGIKSYIIEKDTSD